MFDPPSQSPRSGMWIRFALAAAVIIALAAAVTATVALRTVGKVATNLTQGGPQIKSPALTADQAGAAQTILVIGSDRRALTKIARDRSLRGSTDTMLLLRMDPQQGQTSILSIPRDLMVSYSDQNGNYHAGVKINSAYSAGGTPLVLKVVKQTLGDLTINHVIDLNFQAFRRVVDAIGCVYVDVDRRYFNKNLGTAATNYADIDIEPGYQRLCGQPALDYVRYRHTDSDFTRVARQQDFIRQVKEQVGVEGLINNYGGISSAVGKAIQTDIRGTTDVLRLIKLVAFSLAQPIRQVKFQVTSPAVVIKGQDFVTASPEVIQHTVDDFLSGTQKVRLASTSGRASRRSGRGATSPAALGLLALSASERQQERAALAGSPVPVYLPSLRTSLAVPADQHAYTVRDGHGALRHGYRVDWRQTALGGYYGVEGMDWTDPPLIAHPTETRTISGRRFMLINDGGHIHVIAWRTASALYWVSNTLLEDLSNGQMLAIARSTRLSR